MDLDLPLVASHTSDARIEVIVADAEPAWGPDPEGM
jgi:hypothetical protein